jgi:hypothetical protein
MSPRIKRVIVSEQADLDLVVGQGESALCFAVCSRTLASQSEVFECMFYGPWKESKARKNADRENPWTVTLPDDDPASFGLVLLMVHKHPARVLRDEFNDVKAVFGVLVITNKYLMAQIVEPYAASWSNLHLARGQASLTKAFIAWEIGNFQALESLLREIYYFCTVETSAEGEEVYVFNGETFSDFEELPWDLIGR